MMRRSFTLLFLYASFTLLCSSRCALAQNNSHGGDYERATEEFRAGHYASASALFESAEAASPGATDALLFEGKALVHIQNFAKAEQVLRTYSKRHRDSSDALYMLAFVLHRQNQPAESLETYTRAAALAPPTGDDLKIIGLNYVLLNDYPDAVRWLERAVEVDPKNRDVWYYLGRAYYTKARLPEANKAFLTVLDLHPQDAKAENNLGLIFETSGQPTAAIDAYKKAIAWQDNVPHPSEQPYVNLGSLLLEQGHVDEALVYLEQAVALAPSNAFCHMKLGIAYRQVGRLVDARRELEQATQLEPENPTAHYQLGRLYKELHFLDRARVEFERTAELQGRAAQPESSIPDR
jgi:tetratricopeptide (TPR) repeat protein